MLYLYFLLQVYLCLTKDGLQLVKEHLHGHSSLLHVLCLFYQICKKSLEVKRAIQSSLHIVQEQSMGVYFFSSQCTLKHREREVLAHFGHFDTLFGALLQVQIARWRNKIEKHEV